MREMPLLLVLTLVTAPLPVVALDAGHGGTQTGALGICGMVEKDLTLTLAQQVAAILTQSKRARPVLTRSRDATVGLTERSQLANAAGATLFLSIHGNASPNTTVRGIETYFLSNRAATGRIEHLANRENDGEAMPAPREDPTLQRILQGLSLDAAHLESQRFAVAVQRTLGERLPNHGRGVLQAPFVVLVNTRMAAALVEVGFLTQPDECQLLASAGYQDTLAQALAAAILAHLANDASAMVSQATLP